MNINIRIIPHAEQRYDTCGDWWLSEAGDLEIRVSAMGDWRHEALVAHHELTEALLCKERGITTEQVDVFDREHVESWDRRKPFVEPGDHPEAPYHKEHFFATSVERLLCAELGVDWFDYDDVVSSL